MGILSRQAIEKRIGSREIKITPVPKEDMKIGQLTFWKVEEPGGRDDIPARQFDRQQTAKGTSASEPAV